MFRCFMAENLLDNNGLQAKRQPCEVYSRIVGYLRPISQWNKGKRAEFNDRRAYDQQLKEE